MFDSAEGAHLMSGFAIHVTMPIEVPDEFVCGLAGLSVGESKLYLRGFRDALNRGRNLAPHELLRREREASRLHDRLAACEPDQDAVPAPGLRIDELAKRVEALYAAASAADYGSNLALSRIDKLAKRVEALEKLARADAVVVVDRADLEKLKAGTTAPPGDIREAIE